MTLERFTQLWTHRYHKYSHIFKAHFLAYNSWLHFRLVKFRLGTNQKLIALVRTEHFGDIVAAEPISRYIKSLYPDAYVVWFVKPAFSELVAYNPVIDETFHEFCVTQRRVLIETGIFDEVFELQFSNNNHCITCQVVLENLSAQARNIHVFNYFYFGNLLEVFAKTGNLIANSASFPADDQPRIHLQDQHRTKVDLLALPDKFIVLHCQSNYAPKDWPAASWNQLVTWLTANYDYDIVEIGLKSTLSVSSSGYHDLCGKLTILETAEVIRRASCLIGLDSGPSHLGNAVGTYGIILMGSLNDFPQYNPYSGRYGNQTNAVFVRQNGVPCSQLSFEFVKGKVAAVLQEERNR